MLKSRDRIAWIQSFNPTSDEQRELLARIFKIDAKWLHVVRDGDPSKVAAAADMVKAVIDASSKDDVKDNLYDKGYRVYEADGEYFAVSFKDSTIFSLDEQGIETDIFETEQEQQEMQEQEAPKVEQEQSHVLQTGLQVLAGMVGAGLAAGSGGQGGGGGQGGPGKKKKRRKSENENEGEERGWRL